MEKGKFKWEMPELVKLSQIVTRGFCVPGSGDGDICLDGVAATGTWCGTGTGGGVIACGPGTSGA
jgi:hypothetical protein